MRPANYRVCAIAVVLLVGAGALFYLNLHSREPAAPVGPTGSGDAAHPAADTVEVAESEEAASAREVLFCFWNVENLFDDRRDRREHPADREFDAWLADDAAARNKKLENLAEVLLAMNGRRGPDILAMAEVEGARAAELLAERLNRRAGKNVPPYKTILAKDIPGALRHITPAVVTRLDAVRDRTRLLGNKQRILECELEANGHRLTVIASHWTARTSDAEGGARGRYADTIYRAFRAAYARDPKVDLLVCGDFNDEPDQPSVREHLHAIGASADEKQRVRAGGANPSLLNLFAASDGSRGTHNFRGQWHHFDQIVVSPGMLDDRGWTCEPASAEIWDRSPPADRRPPHRPRRFGSPTDRMPLQNRGYSDHLPVTVKLRVAE